jgi:hypothetical protein
MISGSVLILAGGASNAATARQAGRHLDTIRAWRKRFATERPAALVDRPRPLGRPRLSPDETFFSTLTRRLLRRGQFTSRDDLAEKSMSSSRPTTSTTPSPTAGPTTAPLSKPSNPRRTNAALH